MSNAEPSIERFVGQCQVLCASIDYAPVAEWLGEFRQLATHLPASASRPEQIVIRGLLCELLFGAARKLNISDSPLITVVGDLVLRRHWPDDVRAAFERCVERIAEHVRMQAQPARRVTDNRVELAIETIRRRHAVQHLALAMVARDVGVSARHLARLMREHSGESFGQHLRRIRVLHAQSMLRNTNLSVKEIAYSVGYSSTTQLDRHFTQQFGMSPVQFRSVVKQIAEYPP